MAECLQDLLQCSICLERFTQPKMLPCQHTFCLSCLRGIAKDDKTLACPQCRVEHQLPKGSVQGLPDNILAKKFLSMFGENVTITTGPQAECFDCHRKANLSECQHCKESVCAICGESHAKLLQEIQMLLEVEEENAEGKNDILADLIKVITEKKAEIPEKFNELREDIEDKLAKREKKLTQFLETMEKRVTVAVSDGKKLSDEMKDELDTCKTMSTLKEFKNLLDRTEKGMSTYLENHQGRMDVNYCGLELNGIGTVKINNHQLEVEEDSTMTQDETHQLNQLKAGDMLPKNVNYKEKDLRVIYKHADSTKSLLPDYAIYSQRLDTILCVTEGQVLMYGSGGSEAPSLLSPHVTSCTHVAVTKSGKVLLAENATVHIFDLLESQSIGIGSSVLKREMKLDSVKSVDQICCYGEEFVVLASNEKKMLIFSEEGNFIREFTVANINSGSRMTVDQEGQIYLSGEVSITEKTATGDMKGCIHHGFKYSQLRVTMSELQIHVYSWTGQFIINLQLMDRLTKTFDYRFDGITCCGIRLRNDNSLPNNDQIINDHRIRGLCVDGDGFLSIAMNNQIHVYSQKPKLLAGEAIRNEKPQLEIAEEAEDKTEKLDVFTSVGRHMTPGGGFGGELGGVSLMPDGRMIVCEKGGNRIVIL